MAEFYCTWTLYKVSVNIVFSKTVKKFAFQNVVAFIDWNFALQQTIDDHSYRVKLWWVNMGGSLDCHRKKRIQWIWLAQESGVKQ